MPECRPYRAYYRVYQPNLRLFAVPSAISAVPVRHITLRRKRGAGEWQIQAARCRASQRMSLRRRRRAISELRYYLQAVSGRGEEAEEQKRKQTAGPNEINRTNKNRAAKQNKQSRRTGRADRTSSEPVEQPFETDNRRKNGAV